MLVSVIHEGLATVGLPTVGWRHVNHRTVDTQLVH